MKDGEFMARFFNTTAVCRPNQHYMVDISDKLWQIKEMVDAGQYFTINRARQYGKTTTLRALKQYLQEEYMVVSLDFQKLGANSFENENMFSITFARFFLNKLEREEIGGLEEMKVRMGEMRDCLRTERDSFLLFDLFLLLSGICEASDKPVVLLIDEVDTASNNQVFLDFLAQLRGYYIDRDEVPTFQSVILAGVYDIKSLKAKIRSEDAHKTNSPWNIAADFNLDMSLPEAGIAGMLEDYERDYHTGMDVKEISELIYDYTSGYPFLVSRICKLVDEKIAGSQAFPEKKAAWTKDGFLAAIQLLLKEKNTLFESLTNKLADYPELKNMIYALLFGGKTVPYTPLDPSIQIAEMFGFVKQDGSNTAIANRIFETILYNQFLSEELINNKMYDAGLKEKNQFIEYGRLNMELVLEKFVRHFDDLYGDRDLNFYEEDGRRYFLLYLRPIINGNGNYYIEAETRNRERTDVIIDYGGEQIIVELKVWHGEAYNTRGEKQLLDYLSYYHLDKGYMVSFNFNKKKRIGVKEIKIGNKILVEAVV